MKGPLSIERRPSLSSYHSTIQYLYSLQLRGMKFGLRNIRTLLQAFDDPHRKFQSIHVAGTNGKGSTSAFLASILQEGGYKTGLYTSPHLLRFTERIRINGKELSSRRLVEYVAALRPAIENVHATFFEATTAIAFKYFADEGVEIAVVEVGLGGRLDSTNVLRPLASVITSIGFDHMEILGDTIRDIAREKGGIIKRGRPVISTVVRASARRELERIARERGSTYYRAAEVSPVRPDDRTLPMRLTFTGGILRGVSVSPGLTGKHQVRNVQAAVAIITVLHRSGRLNRLGAQHVARGLEDVQRNTGLRGRYEVVETRNGRLIFDVAHNPDGLRALVDLIKARRDTPAVVVFGVMKDKKYVPMLRMLRQVSRRLIAVAPHGERALSANELDRAAKLRGFRSIPSSSVIEGTRLARSMARGRTVLVAGSHYVVAEALEGLGL